jgi:Flp pilus assembly protein TadG
MVRRGERGANLVEMAIVTPLLLVLLAGVVDIGRTFNNYIIITNAAREGARIAARLPCYPDNSTQRAALRREIVSAVVQEAANSGILVAETEIAIYPDPVSTGCAGAGNPIRITVTHPYSTLMGGILGLGNLSLPSSATMVSFGNDQE